mgnify:CR=1 FL=1
MQKMRIKETRFKKIVMPYIAQAISSIAIQDAKRWVYEKTRQLKKQEHEVSVFLRISDPYSFLLVQVLPDLCQRFNINLSYYTCLNLDKTMYPYLESWQQYADSDARALAELYGLNYPSDYAVQTEERVDTFTSRLLDAENTPNALNEISSIFNEYWLSDKHGTVQKLSLAQKQHLECNSLRRVSLGHYFDGMLHYAGEWYWGLDRLDHLEKRLNDLDLNAGEKQVNFSRQYEAFCSKSINLSNSDVPKIEFYFSARSPYSYIGLERVQALAKFYALTLDIKPVLPMVMRGLPVPEAKKMYIFLDTKREANKFGIAYGKVADPVGLGVEHCYALFEYAKSQDKEVEYLLAFGKAVNAEGVHADTMQGMELIVERAGLDWPTASNLLLKAKQNKQWHTWAECNLQELLSQGLWGVPSIRFGELSLWGQDRIWRLEKQVQAL